MRAFPFVLHACVVPFLSSLSLSHVIPVHIPCIALLLRARFVTAERRNPRVQRVDLPRLRLRGSRAASADEASWPRSRSERRYGEAGQKAQGCNQDPGSAPLRQEEAHRRG